MTRAPIRYIRVKDFGAGVSRDYTPAEKYLELANESLTNEVYTITTNERGFAFDPAHAGGAENPIFVLGDSFVESVYVPQGARFCDLLTQKWHHSGHERLCLNGGYSGSTTLIILNKLINQIGPNKQASVIFVLPSNDALALQFKGGYWNYANQRYSPILPIDGSDDKSCNMSENLWQVESALNMLIDAARHLGHDLHLATTAFVQSDYERQPWHKARYASSPGRYETRMQKMSQANAILRKVASERGVGLLDLERDLADPTHFYDEVHLNRQGSEAMASLLFAQMVGTRSL